MMRTPIYICGFPRSGNSYLSWLLGDLLDSPIAPLWNATALATEGAERKGNYVIHQLHLHVDHGSKEVTAVPNAWTFVPSRWTGERIVFITRDPRGVAVSAMHYWEIPSLKETMLAMAHGTPPFHGVGSWNAFNKGWMTCGITRMRVSYEKLIEYPVGALAFLLWWGIEKTPEEILSSIARQNIEAKRKQVEKDGDTRPYGKAIQLKHLRKGDPYDWKNYFTDDLLKLAEELFGEVADGLGYV